LETIKSGEKIIEALQLVKVEEENTELYQTELGKFERKEILAEPTKPTPNALLLGRTPSGMIK